MGLLADDLLLHKLLSRFRILSQIIDLFVCEVFLRESDLFFVSVLHSIFKLSLNRLGCAEDISELLRDCLVHQLLDLLFWLVLH